MSAGRLVGLDDAYGRAALARLQAFLQAAALRWWEQIAQHKPDRLFGQPQASAAEAEAALRLPFLGSDATWPWSPPARACRDDAEALGEELVRLKAAHPRSPLARLETSFALDAAARDLLLLALVPELGTRHRRLLGYLMDDLAETAPTLDFAHEVLAPSHGGALVAALEPDAPLAAGGLVRSRPPAAGGTAGQHALVVEPAVVAWLAAGAPSLAPAAGIEAVAVPDGACTVAGPPRALGRALTALADGRCRSLVLVGEGGDDPALAQRLADRLGRPVATLDPAHVRDGERRRGLAVRCRLEGAVALAALADLPGEALESAALDAFAELVAVCREERPELARVLPGPSLTVALPAPAYGERVVLWERLLDSSAPAPSLARTLADRFRLSAGAIRRARDRAALTAPPGAALGLAELAAACRAEATPLLQGLAKRIAPDGATSLEDLVVPAVTRGRLDDLITRLEGRRRLASLAPGDAGLLVASGTVALFAGAAGTGKTLAAVLVARALGSDLFKADLSALVSKWVGETEKHLDRLFREAELANAVLFFDEADALFGRRGEIREARDRWANLEVNYLLQRIEEFDGGVILATNLKANIEEAFLRRIETVVEFPLPDAAARARILETLMPRSFARPPPDALHDLAARLPLAGGNLKNIVVHAAFKALAAAGDGATPKIARRDLLEGAAREYEKLGRPVTAQAFGVELYDELVHAGERR